MSKTKHRRRRVSVPVHSGWEVLSVFFGFGTVPLSDELIAKLVAEGWSRVDLEKLRKLGAVYSLQRNSVVIPGGIM
jgi:hypothetical protein